MPKDPKSVLTTTLSHTLTNRATLSRLRTLSLPPPHATDFSSNDFLSLATSPLLRRSLLAELAAHPTHPLGSGGSRLLDGNSPYAETLEATIAHYHSAPCGLLFNSGFDANTGFFACVPQPGDVVVYDEYIHASVHEGMRSSRASACLMFAHNSLASFRAVLEGVEARQGRSVFVAVESLYSMDGDLAPLAELVAIADEVLDGGALFTVDEAHATGVALACNGAIILTDATTRQYLINYARPLIYTTSLSFPSLAAITASYTLLRSPHAAALQSHLHTLTAHLHRRLATLPPAPQTLTLPPVRPTPILALFTPQPRSLAAHLQTRGIVARPIVFPTVPKGTERVRICVHAGNTVEDVEALVEAVREWVVGQARGSKI
ncbi:uncharacterized protein LAJ45_09702 [Morchella importuna]|uniref:uncharacterized protein n=1 Tax=Morchella importuna TaxID=1174673 RepID=UPI001E8DB994|nr:uncharacterized protein LAJ45_09702 [Morchella importuna]KAH8146260.1 hypothetical protein LAJ45_09702 [Morchella importuna]